jgi:hypothetical protein
MQARQRGSEQRVGFKYLGSVRGFREHENDADSESNEAHYHRDLDSRVHGSDELSFRHLLLYLAALGFWGGL